MSGWIFSTRNRVTKSTSDRDMAKAANAWPFTRKSGINSRPDYVRFVVDAITLGQAFARVLLFSSISIIPLLHSRSFINLVVILTAATFFNSRSVALYSNNPTRIVFCFVKHTHRSLIRPITCLLLYVPDWIEPPRYILQKRKTP